MLLLLLILGIIILKVLSNSYNDLTRPDEPKGIENIENDAENEAPDADAPNDQSQNVEVYQNPEFDYQILDITELDNVDSGDIIKRFFTRPLKNLQFGTNEQDPEYSVQDGDEDE